MSSSARTRPPLTESETGGPIQVVRVMQNAVKEVSAPGSTEQAQRLAGIGAWAAIHGLADISTFRQVEDVKADLGGEQAFLRAVLSNLGVFGGKPS